MSIDQESLFKVNPNGTEVSVDFCEYEDITFLVSNCDDEKTAISRVWEFLLMLVDEVDKEVLWERSGSYPMGHPKATDYADTRK